MSPLRKVIGTETYGICSVTGVLIDKSRLRLVPHATKSIDGKNLANSGKEFSSDNTGDFFTTGTEDSERPSGKPIGDKVRLPGKRTTPPSGDDWEIDNETLEDTSYERRKFEDDEE